MYAEKAQEEQKETARCQLDGETFVRFCSGYGVFHERMINIWNKSWGSYFEAKSTNEFKRHLDFFLEEGSIEACCEKQDGCINTILK